MAGDCTFLHRPELHAYTGRRASSRSHLDLTVRLRLSLESPVSAPTYRLETFGKLALTGAASAGVSHQRRRLALLALLAAAGKSGLSRDQLIGYLWPESTSANGRHSLEQPLHGMRRGLGELIFTGTNPVSLNPDVIASDVGEFESAV